MSELAMIPPNAYRARFRDFKPLAIGSAEFSCPICKGEIVALREEVGGLDFYVCRCLTDYAGRGAANNRTHLIHSMRSVRCRGLLELDPSWEECWPDCAIDLGLVRRVPPRRGDALKPSTIAAMASGARFTFQLHRQLERAFGRPHVSGVERHNGDRVWYLERFHGDPRP